MRLFLPAVTFSLKLSGGMSTPPGVRRLYGGCMADANLPRLSVNAGGAPGVRDAFLRGFGAGGQSIDSLF